MMPPPIRSQTDKALSIKDHPLYSIAVPLGLFGAVCLGPELVSAIAICMFVWTTWDKTCASPIQEKLELFSKVDPLVMAMGHPGAEAAVQHINVQELLKVDSMALVPLANNSIRRSEQQKDAATTVKNLTHLASEQDNVTQHNKTRGFPLAVAPSNFKPQQNNVTQHNKRRGFPLAVAPPNLKPRGYQGQLDRLKKSLEERNDTIEKLETEMSELEVVLNSYLYTQEVTPVSESTPKPSEVNQEAQSVESEHSILTHLSGNGQYLDGLGTEVRDQVYSKKGCQIFLEAEVGEVQYILVDVDEPRAMYCFPIHNQVLITADGNRDGTYLILKPGVAMNDFPIEIQQHYRYEIEFGDMFPRCIVRLTKPLVQVHFDYILRMPSSGKQGHHEFPSRVEEFYACQQGIKIALLKNAKFAECHLKHLGSKETLLVVNKQCFPFQTLRASEESRDSIIEGLEVIDTYVGPQFLVQQGDRESWSFHMVYIIGGRQIELRSDDIAKFIAPVQPWHEFGEPLGLYPLTDVLSWEDYKKLQHEQFPGQGNHRARFWEKCKRIPRPFQHRVRNVIDPVHFYRSHLQINLTKLYDEVEHKRDLDLENGRRAISELEGVNSFHSNCDCEFTTPYCLHCGAKFHGFSYASISKEVCDRWLDGLADECTGYMATGEPTCRWNGDSAFTDDKTTGDTLDAHNPDVSEYEVPWTKLGDTPNPINPGEDMPLPVEPWTGKREIVQGRYLRQGHLMVHAEGIEEIRFFPFTGEYIVRAKCIMKIQRFGVPRKKFNNSHQGWKEFFCQQQALPWKIDNSNNDICVVLHTRHRVDRLVIDYTTPHILNHPVRDNISTGIAYEEDGNERYSLLRTPEGQAVLEALLLPSFRNNMGDMIDKLGRISTLCPYKRKYINDENKAIIPADIDFKMNNPQPPPLKPAPRKTKANQGLTQNLPMPPPSTIPLSKTKHNVNRPHQELTPPPEKQDSDPTTHNNMLRGYQIGDAMLREKRATPFKLKAPALLTPPEEAVFLRQALENLSQQFQHGLPTPRASPSPWNDVVRSNGFTRYI